MKKIVVKTVGVGLIIAIWAAVFAGVGLVVFEFSGAAHLATKTFFPAYYATLPLHKTTYYGGLRQRDPYEAFYVQHLHPYYLFSAPWRRQDVAAANNDVVSLDRDGFRAVPGGPAIGATGLLLGGSVAFGQYASSNAGTIAAQLSQASRIRFVNRNAPSWNAHQELIALVKTTVPYEVSVSFSTSNDMTARCDPDAEEPDDSPENFDKLSSLVDDIRSSPRSEPWIPRLKAALANAFLDTSILFTNLKATWSHAPVEEVRTRAGATLDASCEATIVGAIIRNQTTMRLLSEARHARHVLVLQPQYSLHAGSNPAFRSRSAETTESRRRMVKAIMGSDLCRRDCLDLSTLFDREGLAPSHLKELQSETYQPKVFVDEVHMTDEGYRLVSQAIAEVLATAPSP